MDPTTLDLTKRDLTVAYAGRTFALRAYRAGGGPGGPAWHSVIVEDRTPLLHDQAPAPSLAGCFAEAVRCLVAAVEAQAQAAAAAARSGGGARAAPGRRRAPLPRRQR